jgi:hypothetical protein
MSTGHSIHTPGRYTAAMQRAITFTRELGCTTRITFEPGPALVNPEISEIIREWARLNICTRPDENIAGMCMKITHDLVEFLCGAGIDAIYTLGWMSYRDHPVYHFDQAEIRRWLQAGIPDRRKVDVHAWATLPSGELLDPSWLSTVGIVQNKRDLIGAVIIADSEQRTLHQYHPITVDTQILIQIGLLNPLSELDVPRQGPPADNVLSLVI